MSTVSIRSGIFLIGCAVDFALGRISLKPVANLFAHLNTDGTALSREQWLRRHFGERRDFMHRQKSYVFVPESRFAASEFIAGWVARETVTRERRSPDEGLEPIDHASWRAAFVLIDPTHHADGQKMAIEETAEIGKGNALLKSMADSLNEDPDRPYEASAHPIIEQGSFWAFSADHKTRIKRISFDLAVPNMFGGKDDLQKDLRFLKEEVNVARVKSTLVSDTVLNTESSQIKEVVDYTEKGAGRLAAVAEDGAHYRSEDHAKVVTVEVESHTSGAVPEFLRQIATLLDRIF